MSTAILMLAMALVNKRHGWHKNTAQFFTGLLLFCLGFDIMFIVYLFWRER